MSKFSKEPQKRGRPRSQHFINFRPPVYQSPLGFSYTQQVNYNTHASIQQAYKAVVPVANKQRTRKADKKVEREEYYAKRATRAKVRRNEIESEEESESSYYDEESYETVEENPYERLLKKDGTRYFVKFRGKSYIHCDWVEGEEIMNTASGHLRMRKFKPVDMKEEWTTVERVIFEDEDENVLIKWKGQDMGYEHATFEEKSIVKECNGYPQAYEYFINRKVQRHFVNSLSWRPSKDFQIEPITVCNKEGEKTTEEIFENNNFKKNTTFKNNNILRDYQLEGLNWLVNRWRCRQSCIMADEMGLGKTIQSVVFVDVLYRFFYYTPPVIVVAPLSTLDHWVREFSTWTNLRVLKYHGSKADREVLAKYEFSYVSANVRIRLFDVLITTYEMVMSGINHLGVFEYGMGIFDEAHRLKNPKCKAGQAIRMLSFEHKLLLSGTPIQNNLSELWALLNFIDPERFEHQQEFLTTYRMENTGDVKRLQSLLKCLMLRRMKDDVETSIPSKEETIVEVELTSIQKKYYRAILEKNIEFLRSSETKSVPSLMNVMMEIRKCCIHPYLINGAEEFIVRNYLQNKGFDRESPADMDEYYNIFIQSSGKLVLLDKLLNKLKGSHKVLIFSQMTKCLDLLQEYLVYRNFKHERIDGNVRGDLRQEAIDRFSTGEAFVFLLCTKAGGVGINLTAADTCIIFDSDWNPQNDLQAQARCHRIGQTNSVKIYRLITKKTYEREMFDKAGRKLGLDKAILQKMTYDDSMDDVKSTTEKDVQTSNSLELQTSKYDSIQLLLKKGAYGVLMDNEDDGDKFCEEDIDKILSRSKVVQQDKGRNLFSKATFQVTEEIDDPFFWDFVISHRKTETDEGRMKRHIRKMTREIDLSSDDRDLIFSMYSEITGSPMNDDIKQSDYSETFAKWLKDLQDSEDRCFLVFLEVLLNSLKNINFSVFSHELQGDAKIVIELFMYCIDLIDEERTRGDFFIAMNAIQHICYNNAVFRKYSLLYTKFSSRFLFRIQIPFIFHKHSEIVKLIDPARGFSSADDALILKGVIQCGYDNFDVRDKPRKDVMQRLRKLIYSIFNKLELIEKDNTSFKAIINFGKVTDANRSSIELFLGRSSQQLSEIIDKIIQMPKNKRKDSPEGKCYDRIIFFDKLSSLSDLPIVKRNAMPRGWDTEKDTMLKKHLLEHGFVDINKHFSISEELAIKRFEHFFKLEKIE